MMIVSVSRKWNSPEIKVDVNSTEILMTMRLDDFLQALTIEAGAPWALATKAQLLEFLRKAVPIVVAEMKNHSTKAL